MEIFFWFKRALAIDFLLQLGTKNRRLKLDTSRSKSLNNVNTLIALTLIWLTFTHFINVSHSLEHKDVLRIFIAEKVRSVVVIVTGNVANGKEISKVWIYF